MTANNERPGAEPANNQTPFPSTGWPAGPPPIPAQSGWQPSTGWSTSYQLPAPAGAVPAVGNRAGWRRPTAVAGSIVVALAAGFGVGLLGRDVAASSPGQAVSVATARPLAPTASAASAVGSVETVAAKLLPSVVSILGVSSSEQDEGSGIILTSSGLIMTNDHVISGATTLTVQFNDGTTAPATVVGGDSTDDIAVIKTTGVSGLTPATLGTSADLVVGEPVVAVGSPLGLSATVTSGIVSALDRPVRTQSESPASPSPQTDPFGQGQDPFGQGQDPFGQGQGDGQGQGGGQSQSSTAASSGTVLDAIQTDAAINPGNSGGPLVDLNGQVIGVDSAIASLSSDGTSQSGSIGVGFAIPIDQANRIAQQLIHTGKATHAVLGATVQDALSGGSTDAQGNPTGISDGAQIAAVTSGGAAAKAGLTAGDVVTKVGSERVESADALIATIRSAVPGSTVQITYTRSNRSHTADVTLDSAAS